MKIYKFYLACLLLLCSYSLHSQEYVLGFKGGINLSMNKNTAEITGTAGNFSTDPLPGLQAGIFLEMEFKEFFVRPELYFNRVRGEFPFPDQPSVYTIDKISIPLLAGRNIYKDLDLYAGPAFQYFLNTALENASLMNSSETPENLQQNWAAQVGLKYRFENLEVDLRYDFTFDSNDFQRIDLPGVMNGAYFDDGHLNQLMLGVSWKLFDSRLTQKGQRGCFF